ncbi:hypothetical protein [Inquilinus sp. CAU 1745]|uniref:hypothetical protein n=1 Tax=Inquilinus sp. CAU 1745 TaxID=3140369 RepID=UPI00325BE776
MTTQRHTVLATALLFGLAPVQFAHSEETLDPASLTDQIMSYIGTSPLLAEDGATRIYEFGTQRDIWRLEFLLDDSQCISSWTGRSEESTEISTLSIRYVFYDTSCDGSLDDVLVIFFDGQTAEEFPVDLSSSLTQTEFAETLYGLERITSNQLRSGLMPETPEARLELLRHMAISEGETRGDKFIIVIYETRGSLETHTFFTVDSGACTIQRITKSPSEETGASIIDGSCDTDPENMLVFVNDEEIVVTNSEKIEVYNLLIGVTLRHFLFGQELSELMESGRWIIEE